MLYYILVPCRKQSRKKSRKEFLIGCSQAIASPHGDAGCLCCSILLQIGVFTMNSNKNLFEKYLPELKEHVKAHSSDYFRPAKSHGYICPICGSGSGVHGTGITTRDGIHYTCWAGCFIHADIIEIVGLKYHLDNYVQKLKAAARELNINFDSSISTNCLSTGSITNLYTKMMRCSKTIIKPSEEETDYTDFFHQAHANISMTNYHRGISRKTLDRYNIGYWPHWKHPKAANAPYSPRLIIPTSKYSYLARDTRCNISVQQKRYAKSKVGKTQIFNAEALDNDRTVFVVEGEIDALSIIDVGAEAIALGSVSNYRKLFTMLNEKDYKNKKLLLALDNDDAGRNTSQKIMHELSDMSITCRIVDIIGKHKDPNDCFVHDKAQFVKNIYVALRK